MTTPINEKERELKQLWLDEIYSKARKVDPDDEYIWDGILLGWLVAKGVSIRRAQDLLLTRYFPV